MTVRVCPRSRGPLVVEGEIELYDLRGERVDTSSLQRVLLCRCGATRRAPLCDGSHHRQVFPAAHPPDEE